MTDHIIALLKQKRPAPPRKATQMSVTVNRDGTANWRGKPVGTVERCDESGLNWRFRPKRGGVVKYGAKSRLRGDLTDWLRREMIRIEREKRSP